MTVDSISNDLMTFLLENQDMSSIRSEVYPSDRFTKACKPFTVRAMTSDEWETWQKKANKITYRKGKPTNDYNSKMFNSTCIVECTIEPNFKNAEFVRQAGVTTPEQLIDKLLLPGEQLTLFQEIWALSGFDNSLDELKDEVKND